MILNTKVRMLSVFVFFSLFFSFEIQAQEGECHCTNCPQFMPDNFIGSFNLNVIGGTNDDLSAPGQGVCGVNLLFDHQYLGDLAITLTSPSGQSITLVGPVGLFGDTDLSTWDVDFVPCSENAAPDPGQSPVWNNTTMPGTDFDWEGSYYPNTGCLEDFNTGPINGTWTLTVVDGQAVDVGTFLDFEIVFCDDSGINCNSNPCGIFASVDYESIFCSGETVVIDASESTGTTYMWSTDDGVIEGPTNGPIINAIAGGIYTVTVSNGGQCPEVATAILTEIPEVPDVMISQDVPFGCNNTTVVLDGENDQFDGLFYNWFEGNENNIDFENGSPIGIGPTLTVTEPGEYTLGIVNLDAACAGFATYVVVDDSEYPVASAGVSGDIDCVNDAVNLQGGSDANDSSYEWEGPNGFTSGIQNPEITAGGDYTVTVTNGSGCTGTATVNVISNSDLPDISIAASNDIDCIATSALLQTTSAESDLMYAWTGPNTYTSTDANPLVSEGGTYDLVVTSTNGCTATATVTITAASDLPDISISTPAMLDCNTTSIDLVSSSATTDLMYQWIGDTGFASNAATATGVTDAGNYTLVVTAPNNCTAIATVEVSIDNTNPDASASVDGDFDCNNTQVNLQGASTTTGNITYAWTGPNGFTANTNAASTSENGTYTLTVTAENGCTEVASVTTMEDLAEPTISTSVADMLTCQMTSVQVTGSSTTPDATYAWTGPNGFTAAEATPMVGTAGDYTLTVTGLNGCTSTETLTVAEDGDLPVATATGNTISCTNQTVSITGTSSDPTATYAWMGPNGYTSTSDSPTDIDTDGTYTLTITAANGCSSTATALVDLDTTEPQLTINAPNGILIGCNQVMVEVIGTTTDGATSLAWSFGGTALSGNSVVADQAGVYTLVATGSNGCTFTETIEIMEDFTEPQGIATTTASIDCNGPQTISVSSSTADVTYAWTGPNGFNSTEQNPSVNAIGEYTVILTSPNSCTAMTSLTVDGDFIEPDIATTGNTLGCATESVEITGNSATTGVMYAWAGPGNYSSSEQNPMVTSAGTYILTVTGANGCTSTMQAVVMSDANLPNAFAETVGMDVILDCNTTEVEIMGSSDTPNTSVSWELPNGDTASDSNIMATEAGVYTLIVTSDNGCTSQSTVTISDNYDTPEDLEINAGLIYCAPNETQISANSSTLGVDYTWSGPNGFTSTFQSPMVPETGTYTVVVTGANGCTSMTNVEVMDDLSQATISLEADILTCLETETTITSTSDQVDLSYAWTGPNSFSSSEQNPLIDNVGDYTLIVTSALNGCTSAETISIQADANTPVASISGDHINCSQTEVDLGGSSNLGDVTYAWIGPNSFASSEQDINVQTAGIYTLVLTASNGCTDDEVFEVLEDITAPDISTTTATITCNDPTVQIIGASTTPDVTYEWTSSNGFSSTDAMPMIDEAGTYALLITAENGCTSMMEVVVTEDTDEPDLMTIGNTLDCVNTMAQIEGVSMTPNVTYAWTGPNGFSSVEQNPMVDTDGTYSLTITAENGCQTTMEALVEAEVELPEITTAASIITCADPMSQLEGSSTTPNISYAWTGPNGFSSVEQNPMAAEAGDYTLTITAENGCEVAQVVTVSEQTDTPELALSIVDDLVLSCTISNVEIAAASAEAITYTWSGPNGFGADTPTIMATESGDYSLQIMSINGCTNVEIITVEEDFQTPEITAEGGIITCETSNLQLTAASTTPNVSYAWTGPNNYSSTEQNPTVGTAGVYMLTLQAENGCTSTQEALVDLDDGIPVLMATVDSITCLNTEIALDAANSTPAGDSIAYQWYLDGQAVGTELSPTVTNPGMYSLVGVNINNQCSDTLTLEVLENTTNPIADAGEDLTITCNDPTVELNGNASTGQGELTYIWMNNSGELVSQAPMLNSDAGGEYTLEVMDAANGCVASDNVFVETNNLSPLATIAPSEVITCTQPAVLLDLSNTTGNSPSVTYTWTDADGMSVGSTPTIEVSEAGIYNLLIEDTENGCTTNAETFVLEDTTEPLALLQNPDMLNCYNEEIMLDGSESSTGGIYIYSWVAPNNSIVADGEGLNPTINAAGTYTLNVLNLENGCETTTSVQVQEDNVPPTVVVNVAEALDCTTEEVTLNSAGSSEGTNFEYTWTGTNVQNPTDLNATATQGGMYELSILNTQNGCVAQATLEVEENENYITDASVEVENENCAGDENGLIVLSGIEGGTPPYLYAFDNNPYTANAQYTNLAPGTYDLAVQDVAGCTYTEQVTIEAAIPVEIELGENITVGLGESVNLNPQSNIAIDSIMWSSADIQGTTPSFIPSGTTTIQATIMDANGCVDTDNITIFVERNHPVFIPTAFSPNDDMINDVFMIYGNTVIANIRSFMVFDRWGTVIHQRANIQPNDANEGWNGLFRGKTMKPAVFVYYAEIEFIDGVVEIFKGDVSLMR